jgi:DMSO/TMAO reductase YedYZ molybdopterin-dependent catalytic subunit
MSTPLSRREAIQMGLAGFALGSLDDPLYADSSSSTQNTAREFLTPGKDFSDVSRGTPVPHSLKGQALIDAKLTPETWRLQITAEEKVTLAKPLTIEKSTAPDLPTLQNLGKKHAVRFLKAMQCNNIAAPLGQGLWEGVPLREVLKLCGKFDNARRIFYWGFHNNDPKQIFRSSLALSQVLDTPPGEMPVLLAYKLNGEPISLTRGGPVRMIVPWAHGFKSIKWLQQIVLTNKHEANDTYAEQNNDPESYLKTAAYFDELKAVTFEGKKHLSFRGTYMVGWPGLERVEYWLRPDAGNQGKLPLDDPAWEKAEWKLAQIDPPPKNWNLPDGLQPRDIWGFTPEGNPKEWPLRFSIAHWSLTLKDLAVGKYELRVRTVDRNGFAQPEPRPGQKSGRNLIQCKLFEVK